MLSVIAIVVTYNRVLLLKECLDALDAQTYPIDKIVIVDNCSSDGTREWLQNYKNGKYQILYMSENTGGAGGFCKGIKEACKNPCDFVLVLDDDCILNSDYVEELLKGYKEYKNDTRMKSKDIKISALCGIVYENEKIATNHRGYMIHHRMHFLDYWHEYNVASYEKKYLQCELASFCGLMISKESIDIVGYPKEEYFIKCDDLEYSLRLCKTGQILNVNSTILNHKIKEVNSMNLFDWKYYYDVRNSLDMAKRYGMSYCMIKVIVKSLIVAIQNIKYHKYAIRLFANAVIDGLKGNLGKNEDRYKTII